MSRKKKTPDAASTNAQVLKVGSRVRCTDDGIQGRIVWANGTSVKIRWEDGEQVTWRRDALADKPIEFLDTAAASDDRPQTETPGEVSVSEQIDATEMLDTNPQEMPGTAEHVRSTDGSSESAPQAQEQTQAATEMPVSEPASPTPQRREDASADSVPTSAPTKPKRQRRAPEKPKDRKRSALEAAAQLLAEEGRAMTCKEMIEEMAAKGYWISPNGATPQSTLYSAILRELTTKGSAARFQKVERGKFACNAGA